MSRRLFAIDDTETISRRLAELRGDKTAELNKGCRCEERTSLGVAWADSRDCPLHQRAVLVAGACWGWG